MSDLTNAMVVILTSLVGLAIVATLVSKNANTSGVVKSIFGGFSQAVGAATSPVTGGGILGGNQINLDLGGVFG